MVRHGETDWNNKGLLQETTDIELNKEGIKHVDEDGNELMLINNLLILTSC